MSFIQIKGILDEIVEKLPEEFNMLEIMAKVPPEERSPYVLVAFQECERMNMLTNEIRRSLKELDLGLKVSTILKSCKHRLDYLVGLVCIMTLLANFYDFVSRVN